MRTALPSNRGTRGNPFPQLAIGEYKVITSNYKAEFDQVSSAAIVAATKSGTNEFEAEAFFDSTDEDWRAKDPKEQETGEKAPSEQQQYGAALGGPIIQGPHALLRDLREEENRIACNGVCDELGRCAARRPMPASSATSMKTFDEDLFFGKIDLTLGDAHLLELSGKLREESDLSFGDSESPTYGTINDNEDGRWDLRYQYTSDLFLNDAHITYEDATVQAAARNERQRLSVVQRRVRQQQRGVHVRRRQRIRRSQSERLGLPGRSDIQCARVRRLSHDQDRREIQTSDARGGIAVAFQSDFRRGHQRSDRKRHCA